MPNHVTNRLTVFGTVEQVQEVFEFVKDDEVGIGSIDFNKITPMPKWVYQGNLGIEEEQKYGKENCWYDWSIRNWGTKWNAYEFSGNVELDNHFYFLTAWSSPVELIQKLTWIFPEVEIELAFADEDLGANLGIYRFKNGEILEENVPEYDSYEARKMFFEITGYEPSDFEMDENFEYIEED